VTLRLRSGRVVMTAEITLRSRENDVANRHLDDNRVTFCLRGILPFPGSTVAQKPFHLDHRVPELNGIAANCRFKLPGFEFHPVNCLYGWEVCLMVKFPPPYGEVPTTLW
jgi:hypothetical protein